MIPFELTNTLLVGVGLFIIVYLTLLSGAERLSLWTTRARGKNVWRLTGATETNDDEEDDGQDATWLSLYLAGGLFAILLYLWSGQIMALGLAFFVPAFRSWRSARRQKQIEADAMHWLIDVRVNLPLYGSLLRTLRAVSKTSDTHLAQLTRQYLESGFQEDGLKLLKHLAQDTEAPFLNDLLARVSAASEGTMEIDSPFEYALEKLRSEMYTKAREHQQQIPSRLTLLVYPVLLGPAIALLVFPMASRLIAAISGASLGGGF